MLQSRRQNGGEHGVVMTKRLVVDAMLDLCGYASASDLSEVKFTDPAGGDGIYIFTAMDRLHESASIHGFDFSKALDNLRVIEIDSGRAARLEDGMRTRLAHLGADQSKANAIVIKDDFLKCDLRPSHIFAGNPPYVRYDNLTMEQRRYCRRWFSLFRDRSDLYIAFFEKAFRFLLPKGKVCYITPDRWLKNQYGQSLRKFIGEHYSVPAIFNLDGTNPFEEEVFGYPMISLVSTEVTETTSYYNVGDLSQLKNAVRAFRDKEPTTAMQFTSGPSVSTLLGGRWTFESDRVTKSSTDFISIEDQGFIIGIGVATGLDSVFVRRDLAEHVEEKLLLPMVLSKDIISGKIKWSGHYILNPFDFRGGLIDLNDFPKARKYLYANSKLLKKRHVAKNHPKQWFRTIDKIHPELVRTPKLLLPDIKKGNFVALDHGEYYPHHNIYYVSGGTLDDLKILGAVMMSRLFTEQLATQSVMMHGGFVRHQSQNLRAVRIPRLADLPHALKRNLIAAFDKKDGDMANRILMDLSHDLP